MSGTAYNTLDSLRSCPEKMAFEVEAEAIFVESLLRNVTGQLRKSMLDDAGAPSVTLWVLLFSPIPTYLNIIRVFSDNIHWRVSVDARPDILSPSPRRVCMLSVCCSYTIIPFAAQWKAPDANCLRRKGTLKDLCR